jgi:hypothetical protein
MDTDEFVWKDGWSLYKWTDSPMPSDPWIEAIDIYVRHRVFVAGIAKRPFRAITTNEILTDVLHIPLKEQTAEMGRRVAQIMTTFIGMHAVVFRLEHPAGFSHIVGFIPHLMRNCWNEREASELIQCKFPPKGN